MHKLTQAKIDPDAALRRTSRMDVSKGVCSHFSMQKPGDPELFMIIPQGLHWSEVTPSDIVTADSDDNIATGKHGVEPKAFIIFKRDAFQIAAERQQTVFHFAARKRLLDRNETAWPAL